MGTKSTRSSGTQHNPKGVTQGVTLVDYKSGNPIDTVTDTNGVKRLAVDGNFTAQNVQANVELDYTEDSVQLGDPITGATLRIEADGSINTNVSIDAAGGDNIAIKDSDGHELDINPDGSLPFKEVKNTSATIKNVTAIAANTEYSYTFPNNTKRYTLKVRGNSKLQIAFISGSTNTEFMTLYAGNVYEENDVDISSFTIYFQSSKSGEIIEILSWQ